MGAYDDLWVGVEVVMIIRARQLADVDVHAPIIGPIISSEGHQNTEQNTHQDLYLQGNDELDTMGFGA